MLGLTKITAGTSHHGGYVSLNIIKHGKHGIDKNSVAHFALGSLSEQLTVLSKMRKIDNTTKAMNINEIMVLA